MRPPHSTAAVAIGAFEDGSVFTCCKESLKLWLESDDPSKPTLEISSGNDLSAALAVPPAKHNADRYDEPNSLRFW